MKRLVEGQYYKLGELCLVAAKLQEDLWALYLREELEKPVFLVRNDLLFRSPIVSRILESCTTEDLEEIWTLEEVFEGRAP